MFSDAMSSISDCWRSSSRPSAAASSGSESATLLAKNGESWKAAAGTFIKTGLSMAGDGRAAELGHTGAVAAATLECGVEKYGEAFARHFRADQTGTEGQHVGVVMLAREAGGDRFGADPSPDMRVTVGCNRNNDAGAANEHAPAGPAILDGGRELGGEVGIIDGIGAVGAKIKHFQPARGEIGFESFF